MTTQPMPAAVPEGSVIITPSQMYAEIRAMHGSIERLTSTVDPALKDIRDDVRDHEGRLDGHDQRLSKTEERLTTLETTWRAEGLAPRMATVERKIWAAVGAASLIAGGGAAFISKLIGA